MSTVTIQISIQELAQLIESAVDAAMERKLEKWFNAQNKANEPKLFVWDDEGSVQPAVEQQLLRQLEAVAAGERGIAFSEVLSQVGLDKHGNPVHV